MRNNNLLGDSRCEDALNLLESKKRNDGTWQADVSYIKSAWIDFDKPGKPGTWITHEVIIVLDSPLKFT